MSIVTTCLRDPANAIPYILMASAIYYHPEHYFYQSPPLSDGDFDRLCSLALSNWERIEHPHKHLLSPDDLAAGTLYDLPWGQYPLIARNAAHLWLNNWEPDPVLDQLTRIRRALSCLKYPLTLETI